MTADNVGNHFAIPSFLTIHAEGCKHEQDFGEATEFAMSLLPRLAEAPQWPTPQLVRPIDSVLCFAQRWNDLGSGGLPGGGESSEQAGGQRDEQSDGCQAQ